jgi:hypothetical protein
MVENKQSLRYIGGGSLPGIPARELSPEEVEQYGGMERLVGTGLYAKMMVPARSHKMVIPYVEDKTEEVESDAGN